VQAVVARLADVVRDLGDLGVFPEFVEQIYNVIGMVGGAVQALDALASYRPRSLGHLDEFVAQIVEVVNGLSAAAVWDDLPVEWAEDVESLLSVVEGAVEALRAVARYVPASGMGDAAAALGRDIAAAVVQIAAGFESAEGLTQEALEAAAEWADSAGRVLSVVQGAMDAMFAVQFYATPEGLAGKAATLGRDVAQVVEALTVPFGEDVDVERIGEIGDALGKAGQGLMTMLGAMWSVGMYQGGIGAGLEMFIADLQLLVGALGEVGDAFPWWLVPGSPTPLEVGLSGIADEAERVSEVLSPALFGQQAQQTAQQLSVSFGPTTINNGMDAAEFQDRVTHAVLKAVRYGR
jgi:hypothetical protein